MQFDLVDFGYFYLMMFYQMVRVKVVVCNVYFICGDCVGVVDVYCGWCVLEMWCILQQDCINFSQQYFWISVSEGFSCCFVMIVLFFEIDVCQEYLGMILQILGSLFSFSGMEMVCDYGNNICIVVWVLGFVFGYQIVYCNFLLRDQFLFFFFNQDYVIVEMFVRVNGWNIVKVNFIIYDCSCIV